MAVFLSRSAPLRILDHNIELGGCGGTAWRCLSSVQCFLQYFYASPCQRHGCFFIPTRYRSSFFLSRYTMIPSSCTCHFCVAGGVDDMGRGLKLSIDQGWGTESIDRKSGGALSFLGLLSKLRTATLQRTTQPPTLLLSWFPFLAYTSH